MLITIEGVDGSGKDSVAIALKEAILKKYPKFDPNKITILNEPSKDRLGGIVRKELLESDRTYSYITQFYMMLAARTDNVFENISTLNADDGHIVICTRSSLSSLVYQMSNLIYDFHDTMKASLAIVDEMLKLYKIEEKKILLTCDVDRSIARMNSRGVLDNFESVSKETIIERHALYKIYGKEFGFIEVSNEGAIEITAVKILEMVDV